MGSKVFRLRMLKPPQSRSLSTTLMISCTLYNIDDIMYNIQCATLISCTLYNINLCTAYQPYVHEYLVHCNLQFVILSVIWT